MKFLSTALILSITVLPGCRNAEATKEEGRNLAKMLHVSGEVFLIRGGNILRPESDTALFEGDMLHTSGASSMEFTVGNKVTARLGDAGLVHLVDLNVPDDGLEFRSRLLTGLLSLQVNTLDDSDSVAVEADGTEYSVRGTAFVLEHRLGQSRLIVGEGSVEVRRGEYRKLVEKRQEFVPDEGFELSEPRNASQEALEILEASAPLARQIVGEEESTVKVNILVSPPNADIYIDGRRIGSGRFQSRIIQGKSINVRVRKRGYMDETFQITGETDTSVVIELKPEKVEDTERKTGDKIERKPRTEKETAPADSGMLRGYQLKIEELTDRLNNALDVLATSRMERLEERVRIREELNAQVEIERARSALLETELNESRTRIKKLEEGL